MNTNDRPPAPPSGRQFGQLKHRPAPLPTPQALRDHVGAKAMPGAPHLTPVQPQAKPVAPPAPPALSPPTPPPASTVATVERTLQDPVEQVEAPAVETRKPCTCNAVGCASCYDRNRPVEDEAPEQVKHQTPAAHPLAGVSPEAFPRAAWGAEKVARWYIERGLIVFPVCAPTIDGKCTGKGLDDHEEEHKRGKHPVRKWGGAGKLRVMEEGDIVNAWRRFKHNTALPCGRNGGGYTVVLDLDGPEGERTIKAAEEVLGALPATLVSTTGKGRHLLFAAPPGLSAEELASVKATFACVCLDASRRLFVTASRGAPSSFDLRADGGYIVAPGSKHASGAEYHAEGSPLAPLPRAWWDALPRHEKASGGHARSDAGNPLPLLARGSAAPAGSGNGPSREERTRLYLNSALPGILAEIRAETDTPDSPTNDTINAKSLRAFRLALGAGVDLATVHDQLVRAGEDTGHPAASVRATVASARTAAEGKGPEYAPDRPAPGKASAGKGKSSSSGGAGAAAPRRTEEDTTRQGGGEGPPVAGIPSIDTGPDLHRVVDQAVAALGAHPQVYQRRGVGLVRVLPAPDDGPDPGAPIIDPVPRAVLAVMLSQVALWRSYDRKGEPYRVQPPEIVTAATHAQGVYPVTIRPLRGIVEAPTLRRDGSIATAPGYDAASGLFIHWPGAPLNIPESPTREDAREAFGRIASLFAEFKFAGDGAAPGIAKAATVAAMLSPLAREGIDGPCPAFVFEADAPNAGKTLAASVCGALVTGRIPAVRQHTADDDETAKRIASIALAGHPVALFDNVRVHVEGGALEAALSAHSSIATRILGRSEDKELPWRAVLYLTMNGASYSADVARRVVHIAMRGNVVDLDAKPREFKVDDLARHIVDNRASYLRDAFTVLRAHQLAGRPHEGATLPTFEAWSRVVGAAVHWASGHDPVRARPPEAANRDANIARAVTLAWCSAYPGEALTVGALRSRLLTPTVRPVPNAPMTDEETAKAAAVGALRDALAELAGAPDVSKVGAGSLGRRVQLHVMGRVYIDPDGRSVSIEAGTPLHGSARYLAKIVPPSEGGGARGGVGECGSEGESAKRPKGTFIPPTSTSAPGDSWDA